MAGGEAFSRGNKIMITKEEVCSMVGQSEVQVLSIDEIIFDDKLYSRGKGIDQGAVIDYSKNIKSMPAIIINQDNVIVNGVHRYKALLKAEQKQADIIKIDVPAEDVMLAGLLIDLKNGVRHPESDLKRICVKLFEADPEANRELIEELEIPESTFYDWVKDVRAARQAEIDAQIIYSLLNPFKTQDEIAKEFGYKNNSVISDRKTAVLSEILSIGNNNKEAEIEPVSDILLPYRNFAGSERYLYNIWNLKKGDDTNAYFGHFPIRFMKNLLYYHTDPFDFVYDPFAGGGTTIDACRAMLRKYYVTDRKPIGNRKDEIAKWDIQDGIPEMPTPALVFLDPPYWVQAEGKYSNDVEDLGNMDLQAFNNSMQVLLCELIKRRIEKIAIVIQPTQYKNDMEWEDHVFVFADILSRKYKIEMRYILPYSTQQYLPQMVDKAKEWKVCLCSHRDLVVWKLR